MSVLREYVLSCDTCGVQADDGARFVSVSAAVQWARAHEWRCVMNKTGAAEARSYCPTHDPQRALVTWERKLKRLRSMRPRERAGTPWEPWEAEVLADAALSHGDAARVLHRTAGGVAGQRSARERETRLLARYGVTR